MGQANWLFQMALANALYCQDDMNISLDNMDIQLLLSDAFNQQIQAIDIALADKIKNSSSSNLLVFQVVHQMEEELPLFNRFHAEDWTFGDGRLYFKHHLYVPEVAHHNLVNAIHCSFKKGHGGHLQTITLLSKDYWWSGLSTYVWKFISGCMVCQAHKVLIHPTIPTLTLLAFKGSHPFQNLSVDLIMDPSVNSFDSVMVMVDHGLVKGNCQTLF